MKRGVIKNREGVGGDQIARLLGITYRKALIELGQSPDCHIYELGSQDFYLPSTSSKSYRLLEAIKAFYLSLTDFEGHIFVNDILERGRHYRFWYLYGYNRKDYQRTKRRLLQRIVEDF